MPTGAYDNPAGNNVPGKFPGIESFAPVSYSHIDPVPVNDISFTWSLPPTAPLVFAATGLKFLTITGGATGNPSNPYGPISSGVITIPSETVPGVYLLTMNAYSPVWGDYITSTPLTVRAGGGSGAGGYFGEF